MLQFSWYRHLTSDARLLLFVLKDKHDAGVMVSSSQDLLADTGLPMDRAKLAGRSLEAMHLIEKRDGGICLTPELCVSLGLMSPGQAAAANATPVRAVRGEDMLPAGFVKLWRIYPNPSCREDALKEYLKLNPDDALVSEMFTALTRHIQGWQLQGREVDKVPHLRRWLHGKQWQDDIRVGAIGPPIPKHSLQNLAAAQEAIRRRGLVAS